MRILAVMRPHWWLRIFPVLLILIAPAPCLAHAALVEASPGDGAALDSAPDRLRLVFNEPVQPVMVRLIDGNGRNLLPPETVHGADRMVEAPLPPLTDGAYVISFRIVSADGHPVGGALTFRIGAGPEQSGAAPFSQDAAERTREAGWRLAAAVVRFVVYGATLLAAGGAFFPALVLAGPDGRRIRHVVALGVRRYARGAAIIGVTALIVGVGIEGGLLTLAPAADLLTAAPWRAVIAGPAGPSVVVSLAGLLLLATAGGIALPAIGGCVALAGFGLTGHAANAPPHWLAVPSVVVHAAAAAFWIGSLWPLLYAIRRLPSGDAALALRRFSAVAVVAVAILAVVGAALAVLQVGSVAALAGTRYGFILLLKLAAVAALLLLAAINRQRLTPALPRSRAASTWLSRSIRSEMALAVCVLIATAALGTTPPPRALALKAGVGSDDAGEDHAAMHAGSGHATGARPGETVVIPSAARVALLDVVPARRLEDNTVVLHLISTADGTPVDAGQADLQLLQQEAGIEPIARPMTRIGPGIFRADQIVMSVAGNWQIRVDVLVNDFEKAIFTTEIAVR
jgi:copper transport protein